MVVLTSLVSYVIPDMPAKLKEEIRREAYITNEIILRTELQRAQGIDPEVAVETSAAEPEVDDRYSPRLTDDEGEVEVRQRSNGRYSGGGGAANDKTYV